MIAATGRLFYDFLIDGRVSRLQITSIETGQGMPHSGYDRNLERYRPLLRLQIRKLELDKRLHRRFDSSDLIQETLLKAHKSLPGFQGTSIAELLAWLQRILGNVVADQVRRARASKRDIAHEVSLQTLLAESSVRLESYLATDAASPAEQAQRSEQLLSLAAAMEQLPEDQRDVVIHRDLLETPVAEIAEILGRSEKSVAGLLLRGRRRLRELLKESSSSA